jgi:hypothetical protein
VGTYARFAEDKHVQIRADRTRAYIQLKGQEAESLVILQRLSIVLDKANFYQLAQHSSSHKGKKGLIVSKRATLQTPYSRSGTQNIMEKS